MTEEQVKDNPVKNFAVTGYLKEFTKELKEEKGIEPTLEDFNAAISILTTTTVIEACSINSAVMQVEIGEGGIMHLQGYFQLTTKKRRSTFNNLIREHTPFNFSVQNARGKAAQNVAYCTKTTGEWNYPNGETKMNITVSPKPIWIYKDGLVKKGERSDLKEATRAVENGATLRELDQRFPTVMARTGRGIKDIMFRKKMFESKETRLGKVFVFTGGTGTGKSWEARHLFSKQIGLNSDEIFSLDFENRNLWFDGYNGENILLLDDYTPNAITRSKLLRILDIYQFQGQIKGGYIVAEWDYVFITTNYDVGDLCTKTEYITVKDKDGNDRTEAIEVPDPAFISRITGVLDYNDMPDLRSPNGEFQTINRKDWNPGGDVPKSVAPYYLQPWNMEHLQMLQEPMRVQGATLPASPKQQQLLRRGRIEQEIRPTQSVLLPRSSPRSNISSKPVRTIGFEPEGSYTTFDGAERNGLRHQSRRWKESQQSNPLVNQKS